MTAVEETTDDRAVYLRLARRLLAEWYNEQAEKHEKSAGYASPAYVAALEAFLDPIVEDVFRELTVSELQEYVAGFHEEEDGEVETRINAVWGSPAVTERVQEAVNKAAESSIQTRSLMMIGQGLQEGWISEDQVIEAGRKAREG